MRNQDYITDEPRFGRFVNELERKVEGEVSIETIDWIWDEIEAVSVYGTLYSEKYRDDTEPFERRREHHTQYRGRLAQ